MLEIRELAVPLFGSQGALLLLCSELSECWTGRTQPAGLYTGPWQERRPARFPTYKLLLERRATATPYTGNRSSGFKQLTHITIMFGNNIAGHILLYYKYIRSHSLPLASKGSPPVKSHFIPWVQRHQEYIHIKRCIINKTIHPVYRILFTIILSHYWYKTTFPCNKSMRSIQGHSIHFIPL